MQLENFKWESTQFNSRLQPTRIALSNVQNANNLLKLNYDYGTTENNGNVKSQQITVPAIGTNPAFTATQSYTYDSLNRLKSAVETIPQQTGWQQTFIYDRFGNRTFDTANGNTTTLAPGCAVNICNPGANVANNRLTGALYDNAGNTMQDASGQTFVYDAESKQIQVSNSSGIVGTYFYDGDGKRVKKIVYTNNTPSETTIFVYDAGGKMVAEYSTVTANTPQVSYLTNDTLGSPRITTDANGQVISRRDFMPFGEEITVGRTGYGTDAVRQKFTSYERDNETNLDYAKARMFAYNHGRFTSPDPYNIIFEKERERNRQEKDKIFSKFVTQPQHWNRYVYVSNNPLNFIDPLGLIYLSANGKVYYFDDAFYAEKENKDGIMAKIGEYKIVQEGSIVSIGEGARGIFARFVGKQVVLGAGGKLLEITNKDIELGTVRAEYDPATPPITTSDYDISFNLFNSPVKDAYAAQAKYFPRGSPLDGGKAGNPYDGAYRHCVATCLLVRRFGANGALVRTIWDLNNEVNSGFPDSPSDMQGEDIGEFLGAFPSGGCDMTCLNAYPPAP